MPGARPSGRKSNGRAGRRPGPSAVDVVIADPADLDRRALVALLATQRDLRVPAQARDAGEAVDRCRDHPAALLLLSARVASGNGETAMAAVRSEIPTTPVVVITGDAGQQCVSSTTKPHSRFPCCEAGDCLGLALLHGAEAVVTRGAHPHELFCALRSAAARRTWLGFGATRRMLACAIAHRDTGGTWGLSSRECEVAALIGDGHCNKEIAGRLGVGVPTVKKHVGQILTKLRLQDRLQIGLFVTRHPDTFS